MIIFPITMWFVSTLSDLLAPTSIVGIFQHKIPPEDHPKVNLVAKLRGSFGYPKERQLSDQPPIWTIDLLNWDHVELFRAGTSDERITLNFQDSRVFPESSKKKRPAGNYGAMSCSRKIGNKIEKLWDVKLVPKETTGATKPRGTIGMFLAGKGMALATNNKDAVVALNKIDAFAVYFAWHEAPFANYGYVQRNGNLVTNRAWTMKTGKFSDGAPMPICSLEVAEFKSHK